MPLVTLGMPVEEEGESLRPSLGPWRWLRPIFHLLIIPSLLASPLIYYCFITEQLHIRRLFFSGATSNDANLSRLSLWLSSSYLLFYLLRYVGYGWSRAIGYLVRHHRSRAGLLMPGTASVLEYASSLAAPLFGVVWALGNWLILRLLPMRSLPHIERLAGAWIMVIAVLVLFEKILLHNIVTGFHRNVYQDRLQAAMKSLWTVKHLQRVAHGQNFKRPAQDNFLPLPKAIPVFTGSHNLVSTFLLEYGAIGEQQQPRRNRLARLFKFVSRGESTITVAHLRAFFADPSLNDACGFLNPLGLESVGQADFIRAIEAVYQERTALLRVLSQSGDLVRKLDQILLGLVAWIASMLLVPVSGIGPVVPLGMSVAPPIVILTLALSETIKSVAAAILFIFTTHPFDVGDLVYMEKGTYFVRHIRMLSTVFKRWDGVLVTYPNALLATLPLCNVRRTGPQAIRFEIGLALDTTSNTAIEALQKKLIAFVDANPSDYADLQPVLWEMRQATNRLVAVFKLRLRESYQEPYKRAVRFNKFWGHAKKTLEELGIIYEPPAIPTSADVDIFSQL